MRATPVYRSANIRVFARLTGGPRDLLLITFAHWLPKQSLRAPGFAESLAIAHGLDVLCFLCASNAWWLYPDMADALASARRFAARWKQVVTYGSSMGGYAALRYAGELGATRAIAISPQYSIDPAKVPFETRYGPEAARLSFASERPMVRSPSCSYVAVYDPLFRTDVEHVRLIAAEVPLRHVRHPMSGHPAIAAMDAAGVAAQGAIELFRGTYDTEGMRNLLRSGRRQSAHYWITLSLKLQALNHYALAMKTAFIYAAMCTDPEKGYRWAFARAPQMGLVITPDMLGQWPMPDRRVAERVLAAQA